MKDGIIGGVIPDKLAVTTTKPAVTTRKPTVATTKTQLACGETSIQFIKGKNRKVTRKCNEKELSFKKKYNI